MLGTILAKKGPQDTGEVSGETTLDVTMNHLCMSLQTKDESGMTSEEAVRIIQVATPPSHMICFYTCYVFIDRSMRELGKADFGPSS